MPFVFLAMALGIKEMEILKMVVLQVLFYIFVRVQTQLIIAQLQATDVLTPDARHDYIFEVSWSRFGNVEMQKWNDKKVYGFYSK